jgi:hypothetical protein
MKKRLLIFTGIISVLAIYASLTTFDSYFPEISIDLNVESSSIENKIFKHSEELGFKGNISSTVLETNSEFLTYAKHKLDGENSVNDLIKNESFYPLEWRFILENDDKSKHITLFVYPTGDLAGYSLNIFDRDGVKNLSEKNARRLSLKSLAEFLNKKHLDINRYKEVYYRFAKDSNNVVFHDFSFSNKEFAGEIKDNINIKVYGDKISYLKRSPVIPLSFKKELSYLRHMNNISFSFGWILHVLLFLIISYIFIKSLLKKELDIFFSVKISIIFFFLYLISYLNVRVKFFEFNLSNTINLMSSTLAYLSSLFPFLLMFIVLVSVGVYLNEKAFPHHPSIKSIFKPSFLASSKYLYLILISYVLLGWKLFTSAMFYIFVNKLGWKSSIEIFTANFQGLLPFIDSIVVSTQAGFLEEIFFRAVPISLAVLLYKKNRSKVIFGLIIIAQALQFGLAHTNYPSTPFYFRIVELLLPSIFIYGLAYFRYGLFVGVMIHWLYDYLLISKSIIENVSYFGIVNLILTIFFGFFPIFIHIYYRYIKKVEGKVTYNYEVSSDFSKIDFNSKIDKFFSNSKRYIEYIGLSFVVIITLAINSIYLTDHVDTDFLKEEARTFLESKFDNLDTKDIFIYMEQSSKYSGRELFFKKEHEKFDLNLLKKHITLCVNDRNRLLSHKVTLDIDGNIISYSSYFDSEKNVSLKNCSKRSAINILKKEIKNLYNIDLYKSETIAITEESLNNRKYWHIVLGEGNLRFNASLSDGKVTTLIPSYVISNSGSKIKELSFLNYLPMLLLSFINFISELIIFLVIIITIFRFRLFKTNLIYILPGFFTFIFFISKMNMFNYHMNSLDLYTNISTSKVIFLVRILIQSIVAALLAYIFTISILVNSNYESNKGYNKRLAISKSIKFSVTMILISVIERYLGMVINFYGLFKKNYKLFCTVVNTLLRNGNDEIVLLSSYPSLQALLESITMYIYISVILYSFAVILRYLQNRKLNNILIFSLSLIMASTGSFIFIIPIFFILKHMYEKLWIDEPKTIFLTMLILYGIKNICYISSGLFGFTAFSVLLLSYVYIVNRILKSTEK